MPLGVPALSPRGVCTRHGALAFPRHRRATGQPPLPRPLAARRDPLARAVKARLSVQRGRGAGGVGVRLPMPARCWRRRPYVLRGPTLHTPVVCGRSPRATGVSPGLPAGAAGPEPSGQGSEYVHGSWDPKGGELYLVTTKPWETAVDVGRLPDVQIVWSERGMGVKGQSNRLVAGFLRSFPQDSRGRAGRLVCFRCWGLCPVKQRMRGPGEANLLDLFSNCERARG